MIKRIGSLCKRKTHSINLQRLRQTIAPASKSQDKNKSKTKKKHSACIGYIEKRVLFHNIARRRAVTKTRRHNAPHERPSCRTKNRQPEGGKTSYTNRALPPESHHPNAHAQKIPSRPTELVSPHSKPRLLPSTQTTAGTMRHREPNQLRIQSQPRPRPPTRGTISCLLQAEPWPPLPPPPPPPLLLLLLLWRQSWAVVALS